MKIDITQEHINQFPCWLENNHLSQYGPVEQFGYKLLSIAIGSDDWHGELSHGIIYINNQIYHVPPCVQDWASMNFPIMKLSFTIV